MGSEHVRFVIARSTDEAELRKRGSDQDWADERRKQAERVAAELQAKTLTSRVSQLKDWNEKDLRIATALRAKLSRLLLKVSDDVEDASDGLPLRLSRFSAWVVSRSARPLTTRD